VKSYDGIKIDPDLCTGCRQCAAVCPVNAIEGEQGGTQIINQAKCVMCGQCIQVCSAYDSVFEKHNVSRQKRLSVRHLPEFITEPLFAAHSIGDLLKVRDVLKSKTKFMMVQCAPAVRVALAEEFGLPLGSLVPGKMAAALRRIGFNRVYDTNFAADLTIMEEASELVSRVRNHGLLPMFTSCCPAWVKFVETHYPEFIDNLSSCKSPQQMAGSMFKTYGASVDGVEPERVYSVAIMPCTCKKFEAERREMKASGYQDVDAVLTTRELAYLIKEAMIDFSSLPEETFDKPLGVYSGAGSIFGITGGVTEAAIRTAYEMLTGKQLSDVDVTAARGEQSIKRLTLDTGELKLKTVVVAGLKNVVPILENLKQGEADFHFMEVMTCPAGCISGGGQPKMLLKDDSIKAYDRRGCSIYEHDKEQYIRKSHENPEIQDIYQRFLGEPLGHQAHKLLHTHYKPKKSV